eukprot:2689906-Rhodomonas_salina.1
MCGTEIGYGATRQRAQELEWKLARSPILLRACYAMPSSDTAITLRACYAMSRTDLAYDPTRALCDVQY